MPSPTKHYAALILGSGQSGTPLASHLATLPQFPSVCIVERTHIAGCCVNEGCTPTKTMVASARVAHLARRAADYGVSAEGGEVQIDMQKVRQRKRDIVNSFRGGSERRLANAKGVDVVMGEAKFVGQKEVEIELNTKNDGENGKMAVSADSVFINVGCRPSRPAIPGLESVDQERVLDSTSVQELGEVPKHLVVVGGGYIGLEFGQLLRRLGAKVTIVHRGGRLLGKKDDPECVECMQGILRDEGVEILLNVSGSELSKSKDPELPITISTSTKAGEKKELNASHILFATGRIPNTDTLNLSAAGIETTPSGHIHVSPTLATSVDGVYALGDVKGGPAFTHVSYDDFRIIRDNLAVQGTKTEGKVRTTTEKAAFVPSVVYTDPQFAHIGPKWGDLPKNQDLITYSMPGSWIARGLETDETKGMLKAVVDSQTNRIVSFSAICTEGGEVMAVVQIAMLAGMTWMQLREAVFAHPSWSESLNNVWGGERTEVRFE